MVNASKPHRKAAGSFRSASPKNGNPKFTGELAKPILVKHYHSTLVGRSKEEAVELNARNLCDAWIGSLRKLELLFVHYGIPRTQDAAQDYKWLAFGLAQDFVPGFQLADSASSMRGRPLLSSLTYVWLLTDAEVIKRRKQHTGAKFSDASVVCELVTNSQFSSRWGRYRGKERTLANLLSKARDPKINPIVPFWERADANARNEMIKLIRLTKKDI